VAKTNLSSVIDELVREAISETLRGVVTENESDERYRMERALRQRYTEAEDDEGDETGIDPEKIVPGSEKERKDDDDKKSSTGQDEPPDIAVPDEEMLQAPTYDFVKEQINSFRAGASLNNETVDSNFRKYFEALPDAEKRSFVIYSTAMAQLARGMMPADEVITASKAGLSQSPEEKNSAPESEDDAVEMTVSDAGDGAMPIVVGESAVVRNLIERARRRH